MDRKSQENIKTGLTSMKVIIELEKNKRFQHFVVVKNCRMGDLQERKNYQDLC